IWRAAVALTAASLLPGAAVSYALAGPFAAVATAATAASVGVALALAVNGWRRRVCQALSRLEEHGGDYCGGPLQSILDVAAERVRVYQEQSQQHLQEKLDLETRFHVRNKRLQRAEA